MTDGDYLARRIVAETDDDGDRRALAAAFGEADVIARHLPVSAVQAIVRAAWTDFCALDAATHGNPSATALRQAAIALLIDAAEVMEPIVTIPAPRDASGVGRRPEQSAG